MFIEVSVLMVVITLFLIWVYKLTKMIKDAQQAYQKRDEGRLCVIDELRNNLRYEILCHKKTCRKFGIEYEDQDYDEQ